MSHANKIGNFKGIKDAINSTFKVVDIDHLFELLNEWVKVSSGGEVVEMLKNNLEEAISSF